MTTLLTHRGYTGTVDFDLESNCLHGSVLFVNDLITYQGATVAELKQTFESAIEDYLETCAELGKAPDKPFSGSFNVRIDPELHKALALKAASLDESLNAVTAKAIAEFLEEPLPQEVTTHIHKYVIHFNESSVKPYTYNLVDMPANVVSLRSVSSNK